MQVLARYKPGVARAAAQAELDMISKRLEQEYPGTNQARGVEIAPLDQEVFGEIRVALLVLLGAVGFVLLIVHAAEQSPQNWNRSQPRNLRPEPQIVGLQRCHPLVAKLREPLVPRRQLRLMACPFFVLESASCLPCSTPRFTDSHCLSSRFPF
jgi:hypothetical protein